MQMKLLFLFSTFFLSTTFAKIVCNQKESGHADILFLLDTSQDMCNRNNNKILNNLKEGLKDMFEYIQDKKANIRVAIATFNDKMPIMKVGFTNILNDLNVTFEQNILNQNCSGKLSSGLEALRIIASSTKKQSDFFLECQNKTISCDFGWRHDAKRVVALVTNGPSGVATLVKYRVLHQGNLTQSTLGTSERYPELNSKNELTKPWLNEVIKTAQMLTANEIQVHLAVDWSNKNTSIFTRLQYFDPSGRITSNLFSLMNRYGGLCSPASAGKFNSKAQVVQFYRKIIDATLTCDRLPAEKTLSRNLIFPNNNTSLIVSLDFQNSTLSATYLNNTNKCDSVPMQKDTVNNGTNQMNSNNNTDSNITSSTTLIPNLTSQDRGQTSTPTEYPKTSDQIKDGYFEATSSVNEDDFVKDESQQTKFMKEDESQDETETQTEVTSVKTDPEETSKVLTLNSTNSALPTIVDENTQDLTTSTVKNSLTMETQTTTTIKQVETPIVDNEAPSTSVQESLKETTIVVTATTTAIDSNNTPQPTENADENSSNSTPSLTLTPTPTVSSDTTDVLETVLLTTSISSADPDTVVSSSTIMTIITDTTTTSNIGQQTTPISVSTNHPDLTQTTSLVPLPTSIVYTSVVAESEIPQSTTSVVDTTYNTETESEIVLDSSQTITNSDIVDIEPIQMMSQEENKNQNENSNNSNNETNPTMAIVGGVVAAAGTSGAALLFFLKNRMVGVKGIHQEPEMNNNQAAGINPLYKPTSTFHDNPIFQNNENLNHFEMV